MSQAPAERERAITRDAARVSVVIPTWNGGPRFRAVLDALASQALPREEGGRFELVVIDSGSTDGTRELAAAYGAYVERIDQRTFNHGATRNLGISRTRGEVIALLTQDALPVGPDYLANLVAPYEDPTIDGCYARQVPQPDCDPLLAERLRQWSASRLEPETRSLVAGDPEASRRRFQELPPIERYLTSAFDDVASSVRRSTWERIPLPHQSFGEDVAWARSVLLAGGTIHYEPTAVVEHSHRIDMGRETKRLYCDHRNLLELFELRNVPTWGHVWRGWHHQRRFYRNLLENAEGQSRLQRWFWRAYSVPYALAETTAQFLGARSHWKVPTSRVWTWVDKRMRKGV